MVDVAHQQQQLTRFPSGAALPPPVLLLPPSPQRMLTRKNSAESATTFCVAQIISAMESVFQWGCDHVTIVDVLTVRARPSTPPFTPLHSARVQHHVWWCIPCTSALDLSNSRIPALSLNQPHSTSLGGQRWQSRHPRGVGSHRAGRQKGVSGEPNPGQVVRSRVPSPHHPKFGDGRGIREGLDLPHRRIVSCPECQPCADDDPQEPQRNPVLRTCRQQCHVSRVHQ